METQHLLEDKKKVKGLNVGMTVFLLAGELIGTGVITLPFSVITAGPSGFILMVLTIVFCGYGAVTVGRCWQIVIARYPEYDTHVRDPYPVMGQLCYGAPMRIFVRIMVYLMQFGSGVVVLLLAAEMANALGAADASLPYCIWIVIFGAGLIPLLLLGSPKDFWQAGLLALLATILTAILVVAALASPSNEVADIVHPEPTFKSVILSFTTICFANSGISAFPTIQNDMRNKGKFSSAVIYSYIIMLALFLPITSLVYFNFSGVVQTNILLSLKPSAMIEAAKISMVVHTVLAFLIIINPVLQDFEELVKVKKEFGIGRIISRVFIMLLAVFVGESIPNFSYLLNVIGGVTIPLLSLVLPSVFYLHLTSKKGKLGHAEDDWVATWYQKIIMVFLIIFGIASGIIATGVSVYQMTAENTFVLPCYLAIQ